MKIKISHFNQEQFYKVKRKEWRKRRLRSMKCILEITLQKINKNYKSQFLSYNIKNISIFKLPLRVAGILFIFGRHMLNKAFVDLEYITVILFNRWLAYQWINVFGSKQVSPFFSAFAIPATFQPLKISVPLRVWSCDFRNQEAILLKLVSWQQVSLTSICSTFLLS